MKYLLILWLVIPVIGLIITVIDYIFYEKPFDIHFFWICFLSALSDVVVLIVLFTNLLEKFGL